MSFGATGILLHLEHENLGREETQAELTYEKELCLWKEQHKRWRHEQTGGIKLGSHGLCVAYGGHTLGQRETMTELTYAGRS